MRSPQERAVWSGVLVVLLAAAAAAWWTAERWTPHAGPWARKTWLSLTRPAPLAPSAAPGTHGNASVKGAAGASITPRKCVADGRVTYTDQACPPGSREDWVDGGAVSVPK